MTVFIFLQFRQEYRYLQTSHHFFVDAFYIHEPPSAENKCEVRGVGEAPALFATPLSPFGGCACTKKYMAHPRTCFVVFLSSHKIIFFSFLTGSIRRDMWFGRKGVVIRVRSVTKPHEVVRMHGEALGSPPAEANANHRELFHRTRTKRDVTARVRRPRVN